MSGRAKAVDFLPARAPCRLAVSAPRSDGYAHISALMSTALAYTVLMRAMTTTKTDKSGQRCPWRSVRTGRRQRSKITTRSEARVGMSAHANGFGALLMLNGTP